MEKSHFDLPLTNGGYSKIDREDVERVTAHRWCRHHSGYVTGYVCGKTVRLHRHIMGEAVAGTECDHINGDPLDNRKSNLRPATRNQNRSNTRKERGCTSLYKGVTWDRSRGRWRAQINNVDPKTGRQKCTYLGTFGNEFRAALAYDAEARKRYGEYARCNYPAPVAGFVEVDEGVEIYVW